MSEERRLAAVPLHLRICAMSSKPPKEKPCSADHPEGGLVL